MLNQLLDRMISLSASCLNVYSTAFDWIAGWPSGSMIRPFIGKLKNRQIKSVFTPVLYELPQEFVYSHMHNSKVKVKVKFTLEQATKAQRGNRSIVLLFL